MTFRSNTHKLSTARAFRHRQTQRFNRSRLKKPLSFENLEERRVMATSIFQEGVDNGFGVYSGERDIEVRQNAATTPRPAGNGNATNPQLAVDFADAANAAHVLLRFDNIFGTGPGQIPLGAIIVSASLQVTTGDAGDGATLHRALMPWSETTATWNSMTDGLSNDGVEATVGFNGFVGNSGRNDDEPIGTTSINITDDLRAWSAGADNYGWAIRPWNSGTDAWTFAPSEHPTAASRPKLVVEWLPAGTRSASFRHGVGGYAGAVDTQLEQANPTTDNSVATSLGVDKTDARNNEAQTLVRFDNIIGTGPGQIPPGSIIQYAYLDLVSSISNSQGNGGTFHRMNSPWAATDTWTLLGDGAAPRNASPGIQNDGAEAQTGFTYSAGSAALTPLVRSGNNNFLVTSDLQAWVDGEANNGWAILPWTGGTNGWFINSSEAAEHLRPQLRVVFSPPVVEPVVNQLDINAQGALQYAAGAQLANNVSVQLNGGNYSITDPSGPITLSAGALAAGWTGSGTNTVTGPTASVQTLSLLLGTGNDTAQVVGYDDALSIDAGGDGGDIFNIASSIVSTSDLTLTNFGQLNVASNATINLGAAKFTVQASAGVGTSPNPLRTTVGALSADGGAGGVYVVESDGAEFAATATGTGEIRLATLTGALTISGLVATDSGNITLRSADAVIVNDQVGDTGTLGQILIQANTDGIGSEGYLQGTTGILGTVNATSQAIVIEVNQAASGSANAVIGPAVTAGDFVVRAQGGSVLWNPGFTVPAFSASNSNVIRANNYLLSTTSATGSIGTLASPIQTDNLANTSTATLVAGSGGIYLTDWGGADLIITQATATGSGSIQLVAANAGGHNLVIGGTVTTGSGDIFLLADDDMFINGTVGGSGFSGKIRVQANRDAGNEQRIVFGAGSRVETTNTTAEAIVLEVASLTNAGSPAAGGILLNGLIQSGDGGTITLDAASGTVAGRSGKIEWLDGLINAGATGTVILRARYHYIGYAGFPILVNAGNVQASTTAPPDVRGGAEDPGIFISTQGAASFSATTGSLAGASPLLGNINLRTQSGKLMVNGPINTDGAATVTLFGDAGVDVNGALGDADTTGTITVNGNTGAVNFLSDLEIGGYTVSVQSTTLAQLGPTTNIASTGTLASASGVVLGSGDVLVGSGTVSGTVIVQAGGKISPNGVAAGRLTLGGVDFSAATTGYTVQVAGLAAGTEHDQLVITGGPLQLGGALDLSLNFVPSVGDTFRLIDNTSGSGVQGQFTQGTTLNIGPYQFSINYAGGDGNDVVLTLASVASANQAPVLDNTGDMSLAGIRQGERNNSGTLISQIIASAGGDRITDPDVGALEGLAIIGADTTNGSWEYTTDGTTWLALGSVSETSARVLSADAGTRVRFVPNKGFSGSLASALTVRAWDRLLGGGNGDLVAVSATGGSSPFSSATETVSLIVSALPVIYLNEMLFDAPGGDGGQEFLELRGTPNSVIPQGMYFVHLEGDLADNAGMLQSYINLGGLMFGSNGYLLLAQNSSRYLPNANATVVSGTSNWNTLPDGRYAGNNDMENGSATALLVFSAVPLTTSNTAAVDIDPENDGTLNGPLWDNWEVLDSVGTTDADQAGDLAYGRINFINSTGNGTAPSGQTNVTVTYASLASGYFGRIADSTGSSAVDWVAVRGNFTSTTAAPTLTLPNTAADNTTPALYGAPLNHLGASNAVAPANSPPVLTAPTTATTPEDLALLFSDITIADDDTGNLTLTLSATNGSLLLASSTGLTVTGDGTASLNVTGTLANITTALNGLRFNPAANFSGNATLQVGITDSASQNDQASVAITITPVNDAPAFALAGNAPTVAAGAAAQSVNGFATGIVTGPADESSQTVSFVLTLVGSTGDLAFTTAPAIDASGVLTYTLTGLTSGTATYQVVAVDNGSGTAPNVNSSPPQTFTITVTPPPVNQPPVNTVPAPATTNEDQSIGLSGLLIADPDAGASVLRTTVTLPAAAGQLAITAQGSAVVSGSGTSLQIDGSVADINATLATLIYQPAANFNGTTSLSIITTDFALTDTDTLQLIVAPINDEPTFTLAADPPAVAVNAGPQSVSGFVTAISAGPADESTQALTFTATVTATTGGLTFTTAPAIDPLTGTLTYTAAAGSSGTATITVLLTDDGESTAPHDNTSISRTFTITVTPAPANMAPVNTLPAAPSVNEDEAVLLPGIAVADADSGSNPLRTTLSIPSGAGTLTMTAQAGATISGNGTATLQIDGSAAAVNATLATLGYAPATNFNGNVVLTVATTDFELTDTDTLTLTVSAINDEPTFTIPNNPPTIATNSGPQTITTFAQAISVGPADEAAQQLTFSTAVVSTTGGLTFTAAPSMDATGALTYTTAPGASGTATVSVVLIDNGSSAAPHDNTSLTRTFVITVTAAPVNQPPVNTLPAPPAGVEDQPVSLAGISITDADSAALRTTVSLSAGTGALSIVSQGGATVTGNGTTSIQINGSAAAINATLASLGYQPAANFNGPATLSITTTDFTSTDTDTLTIQIAPVNDEPTFNLPANPPAITANLGSQTVNNFVTGASAGAANESSQQLSFITTVTSTTGGLTFTSAPTISPAGTLTYAATAGSSGTATVTVVLTDNGSNVAPNDNTSQTRTFVITVNPATPPTGAPVEMIGDILYVNGTNNSDRIMLLTQSGVAVRFNNRLYSGFSPRQIIVYGNDGADTITVSNSLAGFPLEIHGGDGNDYIAGTSGADVLYGDDGNDRLLGGGGNDEIHGGAGRDGISGGVGNDLVYGGEDNDLINGDIGNDILYGDDGNDRLNGGAGNDQLFGGSGTDQLEGSSGHDLLVGGTGSDVLSSRDGSDVLIGGEGIDALNGGSSADLLYGGDLDEQIAVAVWMSWQQGAQQVAFNKLDANAVDDDVADMLHGEGDSDWYLNYSDLFRLSIERKSPNKIFER